MDWARITVTTSHNASDAVANCLFEMNVTGVEFKSIDDTKVNLIAYYPLDDRVGSRMQKLRDFLAELPKWDIHPGPATINLEHVKSEKWADAWKTAFPPQRIGKRIHIVPTWYETSHNETDILIRLDPGMAFGTGYHPTTRLSLELLEDTLKTDDCVADIGTGSGILSIAAVKLGAKKVNAIEIDPTAIPVAAENFQTNGVTPQVSLAQGDGLKDIEDRYHLIIGNILTKAILPIIPNCPSRLHPEGTVIFSGILETELEQIQSVLEENNFESLQVISEEEDQITWVGVKASLRPTSR